MAMLRKTLVAAVACGAIAFAASAFAQTGAAGSAGSVGAAGATGTANAAPGSIGAGTGLGAPGTSGPGGTTSGMNSTLNIGPGTRPNPIPNTSVARNGIGTSNNTNANMTGNQLAQNNLGTSRPAGTTPAAANPGGGPITAAGALPAGGGGAALGGSGIRHRHVAVVHHITHHAIRRVARNTTVHRITHLRLTTHHVIGYVAPMPGGIGFGSTAAIQGLNLGNTATPVAGLSTRQMARVNARERSITATLNRAELNRTIG